MKTIKFNAIVEIQVEEQHAKEIQMWNEDFGVGGHLITIITELLKDRGFLAKAEIYQHSMYERLNENAESYMIQDAQEDIENEILAKSCIGGTCED